MTGSMSLTLGFVHSKHMGYGRYGSYLYETLKSLGVDVHDDQEQRSAPTNVVCWVSVPTHAQGWWSGQIPTISTMWESSRLPEGFRDTLHEFDTIIVPSWHNVELFSKFHDNVKFVPLGVDPKDWHYIPRKPPTDEFRFLIGGSGNRKGVDLAVRAFKKVFNTWPKDMPRPVLVLKNPRSEDYYGDRIEMVSGRISTQSEIDLYAIAHCYLQPSRGEGFGLQPLQAIAQGLPTILTNAHGHESFAHLGLGIGYKMSKSDYFLMGDAGEWWEPDFEELCEKMWNVYNDYDRRAELAMRSAEVVADEWTWEQCGNKFLDALGRDRLEIPYAGDGSWYTPDARLYPVITVRDYYGEIAGRQLFFKQGETYYETSDIKRILFEGEVLDPVCLTDDDSGLSPQQVDRLGIYVAEKEFCPTCHQRMNSSSTKADEIMAALDA